jgi:hypothetical protein
MKELENLLLEILENQQELISNYYDLLSEVEDDELKISLEENANELAFSHKELIKCFNEILDSDYEEDEDYESEDEEENDDSDYE